MTLMNGNAKLRRAANQIKNAKKLLVSLPKHFYKNQQHKEALDKLAEDMLTIKQSIESEISEISDSADGD
jgi:hypothetical protein